MKVFRRQSYLALLPLLLLSYASLTYHVTTHATVEQTNCEYCAGHGNTGHAIPPSETVVMPPADLELDANRLEFFSTVAKTHLYRKRDPPPIV